MSDARDRLIAALTAAQHSQEDDGDTVEHARLRKVLAAVSDHLRDIGVPLELRADLHKLYSAFEDRAAGRYNELFAKATMTRGTPKKKTYDTDRETLAAAAVEILRRDGWTLAKAGSYVARGFGLETQPLLDYRKNMQGRKLKGTARDSYAWWIDRWAASGRSSLDCVQDLIETARKFGR